MAFCVLGIIAGFGFIIIGTYGLSAPFIEDLKENKRDESLDLEDFDKIGRRVIILGVRVEKYLRRKVCD